MGARDLAIFLTNDLAGMTRGRAFPASELDGRRRSGVGWVPANLALTPFGVIAGDAPFGPTGDLRLIPDEATAPVRLQGFDGRPDATALLCDVRETDGRDWGGCGRTLLKHAVAGLKRETGLDLMAAFEHEFRLTGGPAITPQAFSLQDFRAHQPFCGALVEAMATAGLAPEMILPEYGPGQFEVTCEPAAALAAADRAVLVRDVTRDVARQFGLAASFAPILDPAAVGNGVHVHLSLIAADGSNATADLSRPAEISEVAGRFVAGVLRHLPALCAVTAPSVISYLRLTPHRWSAGFTAFGHRNREAALRVCPTIDMPGRDRARQIHLEFRAADACANPHLVLALLIRAGLEGIRAGLPQPEAVAGDPADLAPDEAERLGVRRLPSSLPDALAALQADPVALGWLPEPMRSAYFAMKRAEQAMVDGLDAKAQCARYGEVY
ncbi:glutamine synthetase [Inquilinus ginsengisoli]|uniref:glutamine synthetase family protein n=1 Tax=Inquilinus ginsengisoli TaxID=363840 RepID=UPI003D2181D0